jgi:hypothetical protein
MASTREFGDELYALPPHAFTAARDLRVAEARQAGDKAMATALAALKRPTVAAWLANLVALRRPDALESLIQLGQTIRAAQGSVTGAQLRDLSAQRRRELDALLALAQDLVAQAGEAEPAKQYLTELEGTLAAAMADPATAATVRAGRTLKPLSYSGFGTDVGTGGGGDDALAAALAASVRPPAATTPAGSTAGTSAGSEAQEYARAQAEAERQEAELRREAAQTQLDEAADVLAAATGTEQSAETRVRELQHELAQVKDSLDVATRDARTARQARIAAERDHATAYRRLGRISG